MRLAVVAALTLSSHVLAQPLPPAEGLVARWSFEGDPRATVADAEGGHTPAPLTIGGASNGGAPMQLLFGAVDEVCLYNRPLTAPEVGAMAFRVSDAHEVPAGPQIVRYRLWDGDLPPVETEVPLLQGVRFSQIKRREPEVDGFDWLHGVALAFHRGALFASWGNNAGAENTVSEIVRGRRSGDGGLTWSEVETIAAGSADEGNSHGVFLVHGGRLWAFHARFGRGEGRFPGLCMEAFTLDEGTGAWEPRGIVGRGIWPLQEPVRMADGRFIVPGCDEHWRAAVAISHGDDLLHWDVVKLPVGAAVHTEAALWVDGPEVVAVMRNESPADPQLNCAAVSVSGDFGRTWSPSGESNFPMATSKPVAGVLSTGQRYLICNLCREHSGSRRTMAIAVGRPGEKALSRLWRIETSDGALAYPYATEHEGHLYVAYSSAPPGLGGNRNDAKLAVIPVSAPATAGGG